ncbi:MAG: response regulator [Gammaproteobacteria bacterium]|nr:response regulator [Gammaproteobacteria bacterium]
MYKILSVDDEPINQAIVEELFHDYFEVSLVSSGEKCLTAIDSIKPELILMDVSMPGIDGYQTCRELKARESTRHIPIIFVSARSTLEDKIKGYEAGGDDYITKPFNHSELQVKIEQTIKAARQSIAATGQQYTQDHEISAIALGYPGDAGTLIQFLDSSFNCQSLDELGQLLLNTCQCLELNCTFQFRFGSHSFNYSSNNVILPLELSLFEQALELDRFVDFNSRIILTSADVSLLIKNMPEEDANRYSELKDLLNLLLRGTESQLKSLHNENALTLKNDSVLALIKENLIEFDKYSRLMQKKSIANIKDYSARVGNNFFASGVNESQAAELQSISKKFLEKANAIFSAGLSLEEKIRTIKNALYKLSRH